MLNINKTGLKTKIKSLNTNNMFYLFLKKIFFLNKLRKKQLKNTKKKMYIKSNLLDFNTVDFSLFSKKKSYYFYNPHSNKKLSKILYKICDKDNLKFDYIKFNNFVTYINVCKKKKFHNIEKYKDSALSEMFFDYCNFLTLVKISKGFKFKNKGLKVFKKSLNNFFFDFSCFKNINFCSNKLFNKNFLTSYQKVKIDYTINFYNNNAFADEYYYKKCYNYVVNTVAYTLLFYNFDYKMFLKKSLVKVSYINFKSSNQIKKYFYKLSNENFKSNFLKKIFNLLYYNLFEISKFEQNIINERNNIFFLKIKKIKNSLEKKIKKIKKNEILNNLLNYLTSNSETIILYKFFIINNNKNIKSGLTNNYIKYFIQNKKNFFKFLFFKVNFYKLKSFKKRFIFESTYLDLQIISLYNSDLFEIMSSAINLSLISRKSTYDIKEKLFFLKNNKYFEDETWQTLLNVNTFFFSKYYQKSVLSIILKNIIFNNIMFLLFSKYHKIEYIPEGIETYISKLLDDYEDEVYVKSSKSKSKKKKKALISFKKYNSFKENDFFFYDNVKTNYLSNDMNSYLDKELNKNRYIVKNVFINKNSILYEWGISVSTKSKHNTFKKKNIKFSLNYLNIKKKYFLSKDVDSNDKNFFVKVQNYEKKYKPELYANLNFKKMFTTILNSKNDIIQSYFLSKNKDEFDNNSFLLNCDDDEYNEYLYNKKEKKLNLLNYSTEKNVINFLATEDVSDENSYLELTFFENDLVYNDSILEKVFENGKYYIFSYLNSKNFFFVILNFFFKIKVITEEWLHLLFRYNEIFSKNEFLFWSLFFKKFDIFRLSTKNNTLPFYFEDFLICESYINNFINNFYNNSRIEEIYFNVKLYYNKNDNICFFNYKNFFSKKYLNTKNFFLMSLFDANRCIIIKNNNILKSYKKINFFNYYFIIINNNATLNLFVKIYNIFNNFKETFFYKKCLNNKKKDFKNNFYMFETNIDYNLFECSYIFKDNAKLKYYLKLNKDFFKNYDFYLCDSVCKSENLNYENLNNKINLNFEYKISESFNILFNKVPSRNFFLKFACVNGFNFTSLIVYEYFQVYFDNYVNVMYNENYIPTWKCLSNSVEKSIDFDNSLQYGNKNKINNYSGDYLMDCADTLSNNFMSFYFFDILIEGAAPAESLCVFKSDDSYEYDDDDEDDEDDDEKDEFDLEQDNLCYPFNFSLQMENNDVSTPLEDHKTEMFLLQNDYLKFTYEEEWEEFTSGKNITYTEQNFNNYLMYNNQKYILINKGLKKYIKFSSVFMQKVVAYKDVIWKYVKTKPAKAKLLFSKIEIIFNVEKELCYASISNEINYFDTLTNYMKEYKNLLRDIVNFWDYYPSQSMMYFLVKQNLRNRIKKKWHINNFGNNIVNTNFYPSNDCAVFFYKHISRYRSLKKKKNNMYWDRFFEKDKSIRDKKFEKILLHDFTVENFENYKIDINNYILCYSKDVITKNIKF